MKFIKLTEDAEHHVRKWLEWIDNGAPEGEPYHRHEGVCHAAFKTFPPYEGAKERRAFWVFDNICKILEQRVGDSCVFHGIDSLRAAQKKLPPTTHDNRYRTVFFRLLLKQQGG